MRNSTRCPGVYRNMLRAPLFLAFALVALAQQPPRPDPLDLALQAAWQAGNSARFEDATAHREEALALLRAASPGAPQFSGWVQQVSQLYQNCGWHAKARSILRESLDRAASLGDSHPARIAILETLAQSWQQDGNLLKAVAYLEQAAAAQSAAPPVAPPPAAGMASGKRAAVPLRGNTISGVIGRYTVAPYDNRSQIYFRLAEVYRQLGRPDAMAAVAAKIRTLAAGDPGILARFYEQNGQLNEAAAIYRKQAESTSDPQAAVSAWQWTASLEARQENFTGAVDAMQKAVAAAQDSHQPGLQNQALWMRQTLANYLQQAGLPDQAGQIYQQLLQDNSTPPEHTQVLGMYAQFLTQTGRAAQGEKLLKDYLVDGASLEPQQKTNVLFHLANLARQSGDSTAADAYMQAGQALQLQPIPPPEQRMRVTDCFEKAHAAVLEHRFDDAYNLALGGIDSALQSTDGQQIAWQVAGIARALANSREPAKAELLFQRAFGVAQILAQENIQPLITLTQNYASFLADQPDRMRDVPAAIEQYRGVLIDANGPESASLAEPLRLQLQFAQSHSRWDDAEETARELLELQESLTGPTSEPYLGDLQTVARSYQAAGDSARALPLFRKAIAIADLLSTNQNNHWRRSQTRMDTAFALARSGNFDEAVALGQEAAAIGRTRSKPFPQIEQQLAQLTEMKAAAAKNR